MHVFSFAITCSLFCCDDSSAAVAVQTQIPLLCDLLSQLAQSVVYMADNCYTPSPVRTERCVAEDMPMLKRSPKLGDSTTPRWSVGFLFEFLLMILAYEPRAFVDCDLSWVFQGQSSGLLGRRRQNSKDHHVNAEL